MTQQHDAPEGGDEEWRLGRHYRIHVYAGDRPVATFHREEDALRGVIAVNTADRALRLQALLDGRDRFIVNAGLWQDFVTTVAAPTPPAPSGLVDAERLTPDEAWDNLINKDDRNSPEEYPEMALITYDELTRYMRDAALSGQQGGAVPAGDIADDLGCAHFAVAEAVFKSRGRSADEVVGIRIGHLRALDQEITRLAEQPAPAGTGDADRVEKNPPPLTCDFENAFPDGSRDLSSYSDVESALDRAGAPSCGRDGRWLTLPQRIAALDGASGQREG